MKKLFSKIYVNIRYFFQMQEFKNGALADFPKLIEVVFSCESKYQCDSAMRYVGLYKKQRDLKTKDNVFNAGNDLILGRLISYLQDTRDHYEFNFHYDENNTVIKTFPDLNDYLNDLVGVRFAKTWMRGKSSVLGVI